MFHFIAMLGAPGPGTRGRRGNCRSWLHVVLNGRQIYNTWKKQLGRGLRRLQSGEINPRNETGKAEGRNELWAGVQRRECQKGPGSRGAALRNRWPADPARLLPLLPSPRSRLRFLWDSSRPAGARACGPEASLGHRGIYELSTGSPSRACWTHMDGRTGWKRCTGCCHGRWG